jgi:hypothetical protein
MSAPLPILAMPLDRFDRLGDPSVVDQQPVSESLPAACLSAGD